MAVSIEELKARLDEIRARLAELDQEFAGQRMAEDSRNEWNELAEELRLGVELEEELEARHKYVADISGRPAMTEKGASFHTQSPRAADTSKDIWDTWNVRARSTGPEDESRMLRDNAMRAVDGFDFPHRDAKRADVQEHVSRLVANLDSETDAPMARHILTCGSPLYRQAFGKTIVGKSLTADEQRSLALASASGGYAVPVVLDPTIIPTSNGIVNPWRQISRVESITGSNTWNGVSSGAITASRDAELEEVSDDTPSLAQPTATVTKAEAFVPFSIEIGQDWSRLESEMASLIQDAKDTEEGTSFATGVGTTVNPQGVLVGATGTVAAGTAAFTVAHAYALLEALPPRFRPNGTFVASLTQYNRIRQLDTAGGASLWVQNLQGGVGNDASGSTGYSFLGKPAYESSVMSTVLTAGAKLMVFGDFRYFLIVDRIGMTVEVVPHLFGSTNQRPIGQRGLLAYWRNTSKVLSAAAFKVLVTT